MAPVRRGLFGALLDRLAAWIYGFPPESGTYTIESLRIPIEKEIVAAADLYRPLNTPPVGTLLVRSPYGIGIPIALGHARLFAARGYQVLLCSCRGTNDSTGELNPGRNEAADGQAVVAWMRSQPWYTGSFATIGSSYLGYVQWALLCDPPKDMKAAVISTAPHDFARFMWGTGALSSDIITWADLMDRMTRPGLLPLPLHLITQKKRLRPVKDGVPLLGAVEAYFAGNTPAWLRNTLTHPDLNDTYWKPFKLDDGPDRADIPILLVTGWNDPVLRFSMEHYSKLAARGVNVALTVGPWTHVGLQGSDMKRQTLQWLGEHLARHTGPHRTSPVRIYVTGAHEWRELPSWPPRTTAYKFYLGPDKKLSRNSPPADAADSTFKFDPANPTPSIAVPSLFDASDAENTDDTALGTRSDVVTFTTEPLDCDVEVCGKPSVELHHTSNHPHVDLLVRLSEVDSKGTSRRVSGRYFRLDPDRGQTPLNLDLLDCAHRFRKGTRIRLLIAGGAHPQYIRNLGTGESSTTGSTLRPAWHTIHHSTSAVSKVVLPVTTPEH